VVSAVAALGLADGELSWYVLSPFVWWLLSCGVAGGHIYCTPLATLAVLGLKGLLGYGETGGGRWVGCMEVSRWRGFEM
jgi:hypothetical protein